MFNNINIDEIKILFLKLAPFLIILLILLLLPHIIYILNNINFFSKRDMDQKLKNILKKHRNANLEKKSAIFLKEMGSEKKDENNFIFFDQYKYKNHRRTQGFIEKNIFKKINNKWILVETKDYNHQTKQQKNNSFREWALKNWPSK